MNECSYEVKHKPKTALAKWLISSQCIWIANLDSHRDSNGIKVRVLLIQKQQREGRCVLKAVELECRSCFKYHSGTLHPSNSSGLTCRRDHAMGLFNEWVRNCWWRMCHLGSNYESFLRQEKCSCGSCLHKQVHLKSFFISSFKIAWNTFLLCHTDGQYSGRTHRDFSQFFHSLSLYLPCCL